MADLGFDPTGAPMLRRGGGPADWVRFLQQVLAAAGADPGAADGDFGPATQRAVEAFQAATGLVADGIVGDATWMALAQALGAAGGGTTATDRFDPSSAPLLQQGSQGDWVSYLQELLIAAGHDPGPVDGIFGPLTAAGVRDFQQANGLQVDGIVGIQTWTALDPFAEAHPTDPPVGSPVHGGGGSGSGGSGSGGARGDARVSVGATAAEKIGDDGTLSVTWVIDNDSAGPVRLIRLEREVLGVGGSFRDARELGDALGAGDSLAIEDATPMGPAADGETFVFTIASVVVFDPGDGSEHRSAENLEAFTVDDQGNVTPGGEAPSSVDDPLPGGDHLTVEINPADRVVDGELMIEFPTHNVSAEHASVIGLDWSVTSGHTQFNRQGEHSVPIAPGETVTLADVSPMGPAADEPFEITITATVPYLLDGAELRTAPAQRTVTIDSEGVVGGSASGGGSSGGSGTPALRLVIDAFSVANMLGCNATVVNDGDGVADEVRLVGTLSGPLSDHRERVVDALSPSEGSVVELGVQLPEDRTDTLLFVFEAQVTSTNAAGSFESTGISVDPDGTVTRG